jgi:hypothetical protein
LIACSKVFSYVRLAGRLKLSGLELIEHLAHRAGAPYDHLDTSSRQGAKGVWPTVAGQYSFCTLFGNHLGRLNASPAVKCGVGVFHCLKAPIIVRIRKKEIAAAAESWIQGCIQRRFIRRGSDLHDLALL